MALKERLLETWKTLEQSLSCPSCYAMYVRVCVCVCVCVLGRMLEPDPSHTLEERVVHWYFSQLDKNASGDIGKKEIKPFKRLLRKKSKPKKCVKKFVEYCV